MEKRKSTSTSSHKLTLKGVAEEVRKPALIIFGFWAGNQIGRLIDKQVTPAVSGLLGLDGQTSKFIRPAILMAGGLVLSKMTSNQDLKMAGYGITTAGGVVLAKKLLNIDIIPLSGDEYSQFAVGETPNLPALEGDEQQAFIEGNEEQTIIEGTDDEFPIS